MSKIYFMHNLLRFPYIKFKLCAHQCECFGTKKLILHRIAGISELAYYIWSMIEITLRQRNISSVDEQCLRQNDKIGRSFDYYLGCRLS